MISVILNILISVYYFNDIGFIIIPIATTISSWFNAILLFIFLKKKNLFIFNDIIFIRFFKIVIASSFMGIIFNYLLIYFQNELSFDYDLKAFYLILSVALGLLSYVLISFLIKAFKTSDFNLNY